MNKTLITLLSGVILISIAGASMADGHAKDSDEPRGHHKQKFKDKLHRKHKNMLKRVDANEDGKIDLSEYLAAAEKRFKNMDLDADGYVTREEHLEASKTMRAKHREMRKEMREKRRAERSEQGEIESSE